jgi:hypothetical protein
MLKMIEPKGETRGRSVEEHMNRRGERWYER